MYPSPPTSSPPDSKTASDSAAKPPFSTTREVLETEVRVDTFRAAGPGGQHVNKTNSAVRLTHLPSGVVVIAQDSTSQFRNKEIAFARLIDKLKRLNHIPKKRLATKPTRASKERRIGEKKTRAVVKTTRSKAIKADE
ncbi:MAG: peptide chain release factor-like protein [Rhodocyclaceae bacterium]|nr:peptide chain release factor-like protein [Rhodocyclaceae bacterium]